MKLEESPVSEGLRLIDDPKTRQEGFDLLIGQARPVLTRYLRGLEGPRNDHDDIISAVVLRILQIGNDHKFVTTASWNAFLKVSVDNERKDRRKSAHNRYVDGSELPEDIESNISQEFIASLERHDEHCSYLRIADNLWLGKIPSEFKTRMIAATLVFWDRRRLSVVVEALKHLPGPPAEVNPSWLLDWVTDEAVLRRLAFSKMYFEPEQLFRSVVAGNTLDPNYEGVLLWKRFVQFVPKHRILDSVPEDQKEEAQTILDQYETKLPFAPSFERVWQNVKRYNEDITAFSGAGLWKRLTYQYSLHRMTYDDMAQWLGKPAGAANFNLNRMKVHSWIANGVLTNELRNAISHEESN